MTTEYPYSLLLVDDNPAEVRLMQEAIKEAELHDMIELSVCFDGEEAIDFLETGKIIGKRPHLVLLDLNMPKVTGKEVLARIKEDPDLETIPVFVVTNSDYRKDMIECYRLRADGYLQKPADFKKLVDFFVSVKRSIEVNHRLSIFYIEKVYDELRLAV